MHLLTNPTLYLKSITGKHICLLFVILFPFYVGVNLGTLKAFSLRQVPTTHLLLDSQAAYTADDAYMVLDSFGEQGRSILRYTYAADFLIPLLYAIFLMAVIAWFIKKAHPHSSWPYVLVVVPFGAMIADYVENIFMLKMMDGFSTETVALYVETTRTATTIKFSFLLVSMGLVVMAALAAMIRFTTKKRPA